MKTSRIQAVDMVRRIRDSQARSLARKSRDEVIAFFRSAGQSAAADARSRPRAKSRRAG